MMSNVDSHKVLIVAAEASSSLYAQRLLQHWQAHGRRVRAFGIGSRSMEKVGFDIVGRSEELAVVGLQEVIAHWSLIKSTFYELLHQAEQRKPDFALLLDYPDFNLRLAKKLKALGIPVIYYISPQIWAWRQGRVNKMRGLIDKMLVLFPFEKQFYDEHGIPCEFVGHPLLDEVHERFGNANEREFHRNKYGVTENEALVGLMPGSRNSELKHHLQTQLQVAEKMWQENSQRKFALFIAPTFDKQQIQELLPPLNFPLMLIQDEPFEMIDLADVVLCASGTATLMVGMMEKPMVIMYKMNPVTAFLARRFVTATKYFGMINLIMDEEVAPEYFQGEANVMNLKAALDKFLENPELNLLTKEKLKSAKHRLGDRGATARVAASLEEFWGASDGI